MEVPPSSKKPTEPLSKELHVCDTKIILKNDDHLLSETLHNHPLYMVSYVREHKVKRIMTNDALELIFSQFTL